MYSFSATQEMDCCPDSIWKYLADPSSWSLWDERVDACHPPNNQPFAEGCTLSLKPKNTDETFELRNITLDEFKSVSFEEQVLYGTLRTTHSIVMLNGDGQVRSAVTSKVELQPNTSENPRLLAEFSTITSGINPALLGLKKCAEIFENHHTPR